MYIRTVFPACTYVCIWVLLGTKNESSETLARAENPIRKISFRVWMCVCVCVFSSSCFADYNVRHYCKDTRKEKCSFFPPKRRLASENIREKSTNRGKRWKLEGRGKEKFSLCSIITRGCCELSWKSARVFRCEILMK